MHKFLIPLVACLFCTTAFLRAQGPNVISVPYPFNPTFHSSGFKSLPCNNAGTFTLGTFSGQSNDIGLDTIYLCRGDQINVVHNGDSDLSGDPNPASPPGIVYFIYSCAPTIAGDNLQSILADPCIYLAPNGYPRSVSGLPNGNATFVNDGTFQTLFNGGDPVLLHFAPATVDAFGSGLPYEMPVGGGLEGPCVNVNTAVAFEVVYLNPIQESGVVPNFFDDCIGKFRISGGYPEFDLLNGKYTVDISLAGSPNVKAVIHTPVSQFKNNVDIDFSVSQPGIYNVTIEDGKSCGHTFQIAMNGCDPSDNAVITLPDTISPPGSQICIPVNVEGFDIAGASFSLQWDPAILQYTGVQNPNPAIGTFNAGNLGTQKVNQGYLGIIIYDQDVPGGIINIPDGESLLEVCFNVIGPLGACSPLKVINDPTQVKIEDPVGETIPLTVDTGQVCVGFLPLQMVLAVIDTTCFGGATLKVTVTGGEAPYEVVVTQLPSGPPSLDIIAAPGGMATEDIVNGNIEVCVTDSNGFGTAICTTFTLIIPTLGVSLQTTQKPTCFGDTDGIVTALVSVNGVPVPNPGPPNFTFNWTPAPGPTGPVYSNVGAGSYFVTVTNVATGCSHVASGVLDQPLPLNSDVTITPATCPGISNGSIAYTLSGGTSFPGGEYQYNWEYLLDPNTGTVVQGPTGQDSLILLTNIAGGTWYVTITDANGCTAVEEIIVPNQRELELMELSLNNTLCVGDSTGSVCVQLVETPASPNPTFSFFWSPLGFTQTTPGGALTSCYEDLPAGSYNVIAIDAAGCAVQMTYEVGSPPPFVLDTFSLQQPNCTFLNNGAIEVIGQGGTGGPNTFTYIWSPGGEMTRKISNLLPGDYSVTAADANGCQDSLSFTLTLPLPPTITAVDSSSVKCGADGSLSVTSPTGVTYQWVTIGGQFVDDSSAIFNLQGDTFVVTIMDDQGCTTMDTFSLAPVTPMSFSDTTLIEPSCFGYDDGSISIGVMDGNPQYTFLWSDSLGQSSPTLIDVPAGDYIVTVTDTEGCTLTGTFTLGQPPEIKIFFSEPDSTSCFGVCDGGIEAIVRYETTPPTFGDFNFVWSDGGTDSLRNDLCADTVSLIAIDLNNCFAQGSVIIPGPPEVTYDTLYTLPTTCFGGSDGQAIVDGAGGNGGPYIYEWSNGATTAIVNDLDFGEYTVTITDRNGCTAEFTTEVEQPEPIVISFDDQVSNDVICFGDATGTLGVTATGGNGDPYTYIWEDADSMVVGNTQVIEDLFSGVYSVTATDSEGCTGELQGLVVNEPAGGPVDGDYLPWEELLCFGDETTIFIDTITGGAGAPYEFSLDFGVRLAPSFPVSVGGGEHYITYYDRFGCDHTDTIIIFEPSEIIVTFLDTIGVAITAAEIELGDSLLLRTQITGAVVDTFLWSPTGTLHYPNSLTPYVYTFVNQVYTLTVFDENGCQGEGSIAITVDPNRNVYVPNVFWPGNPGGLNDHFNPQVGRGVEKVNFMRIYDRWGTLMYSREDFFPDNFNFADGWDGKYRGDYVNPAVFVYIIEVKFLDDRVLLYRGDVTVVR